MGDLFRTVASFGVGTAGFSFIAWLALTAVLAAFGVLLVTLGRPLAEPVVVLLALRRGRVALWTAIGLVVAPVVTVFFVATIIGIPLAVLWVIFLTLAVMVGYVTMGWAIGDAITRSMGRPDLHPVLAFGLGFLLLRAIRLLPYVGGPIQLVFVLLGFGAAMAVSWDVAWSWHRRRLPDDVQFKDETGLIEWHQPDEQPTGDDT